MLKPLLVFLLLIPIFAQAQSSLRVMNFNTMCFFCGKKKEFGKFKQRMVAVADTINRHAPALVSLQEVTFRGEINDLVRRLNDEYVPVYYKKTFFSYLDPVLLVKKDRFDIIDRGSFWLGPNPKLPLGWKVTFPRRFQWVELYDRERKEAFIFSGTHFDNATKNKNNSSLVVNNYLKKFDLPILFAGDTNLKTSMEGYDFLLNDLFIDTFPGTENVAFYANGPYTIHDACNLEKDTVFPNCRIDHVLTSKNSSWKVKSWGVDVFKYHGSKGFASDHRAVIVELD